MEQSLFSMAEISLMEGSRIPTSVYAFEGKRLVPYMLTVGFCELFGYESLSQAYETMRKNLFANVHPDDVARVADAVYRFAADNIELELVYRTSTCKDDGYHVIHALGRHGTSAKGTEYGVIWYMDEGNYVGHAHSHDGSPVLTFSESITTEGQQFESRYDALTGLPNMSHFFYIASEERRIMLERGKRPAILYIDLNGMRHFNRKYGFAEGDKLIRAIADVLVQTFGRSVCSRFEQDHFAVITTTDGLEDTLHNIFSACLVANGGKTLPVRIGIYVDNSGTLETSAACDRAMVACNQNRRAYYSRFAYFNESMLEKAENRQYIIDNLDRALEEQWIQVFYQPIVRAANGRVCDEEALARWIDPKRGLLSPADFIPVLEETRLIYKLDLYMVEQVLLRMRRFEAEGLYLVPISINLSRYDFEACDIVEEVRKRVDAAGISRDMITIEITESALGKNFSYIKGQIDRLHELGFCVWMDDFGSEYSSLEYLQSVQFDLIKLDMRFMRRFNEGDRSRIILTELVRMAIGLGIDTVCEGVETQEQVEFLQQIGCTKLQGFYYTKPISSEAVLERYKKGIAIGFENPAETSYYSAIGRVNLYDLASVARDDQESLGRYFNMLPMAIMESRADEFRIARGNKAYMDFLSGEFDPSVVGNWEKYATSTGKDSLFLRALRRAEHERSRVVVDDEIRDGSLVHTLLRQVAVNPVTGTTAVAVAILDVVDNSVSDRVSFADFARALSSDYVLLYYVDLATEQFVEYSSKDGPGELTEERHGDDFFAASRTDARVRLYADDQDAFVRAFTRENVLRAIDKTGAFTMTYRLLFDDGPAYVSMKATRMTGHGDHIIIGVNIVDAQMNQ